MGRIFWAVLALAVALWVGWVFFLSPVAQAQERRCYNADGSSCGFARTQPDGSQRIYRPDGSPAATVEPHRGGWRTRDADGRHLHDVDRRRGEREPRRW